MVQCMICQYFMVRKETILRTDNIIRVLSHLDSTEETLKLRNEIDKEDRLKLANLFEDFVILLSDDRDNKIMDGYGHIKPISEILESVKNIFYSSLLLSAPCLRLMACTAS
jgi:hypothetical protein